MTFNEVFKIVGIPENIKELDITLDERITIKRNALIVFLLKQNALPKDNIGNYTIAHLACMCEKILEYS